MSLIYLTGIQTTLAYLMGERTVNSTTATARADFIQKTLEECYSAYPWRFATTNATLAISSGIATLPSSFDVSSPLYASYFDSTSSEIDLDEIDPADKDKVNDGDRKFWLTAQSDGTFLLNTKDSISSTVVRYQQLPPTLDSNDTVGTPYPNGMTLALGARRYVKLGQNPDADISQDQKLFEKSLNNDIAGQQVPAPRKIRRSRQAQNGTFTGDF
jgi:hypothetical protein